MFLHMFYGEPIYLDCKSQDALLRDDITHYDWSAQIIMVPQSS